MKLLEPGTQLGHYRIVRKLGAGGMADVYEAEDQKLGRHVALKILPQEFGRDPKTVARFETEVRAAALLNHRNIVTVFEVGSQDGHYYYSMRMLTGGDLRAHIEAGLEPVEAIDILRQLMEAFVEAHAGGFVHRDVKPENIIFDDQGCPVLTDFGIAKLLAPGTGVTGAGVAIGTPRYMSPEQARGQPVDARTDLYSLGVVLFEMLTGKPPFDSEEAVAVIFKHVSEPVPRLPAELAPYQPLVDKLMAKDPAQRPESAEQVLALIAALPAQAALPANSPLRRRRRADRSRPAMNSTTPMFGSPEPEAAPIAPTVTAAVSDPIATTVAAVAPVSRSGTWLAVGIALLAVLAAVVAGRQYWIAHQSADEVAAPVSAAITREPAVDIAPAAPVIQPAVSVAAPEIHEPVTAAVETSTAPPAAATIENPPPPVAMVPPPATAVEAAPVPARPAAHTRKAKAATPASPTGASQAATRQMLAAGRAAYDNKEYKSAISYANSALLLDPGNAEARKLMEQAQRAREEAMKNIGVN